ncbi:XtrA/YqaO family protein [Bacillus benzoevorans]|uniref:DUF3954 domain-containing protein n=1 Tax=Bacillus benzoevorans TaxID=1456 RepID=A0A7X0HVR0_9BACI|nr:XtrA/YqaO family protein [Bacillus benzoevorans]MBB6446481.1 hypothetical protein [Bacillus benzoevorans]
MTIDTEKMTAEINLMQNNIVYVVKDGRLIEHELPAYGEVVIVMHDGKAKRIETKTNRAV